MDSTNTVATFTPSSSLAPATTYTATVSGAQTSSGATMSSPYSWTFTTAGSQCPCSLWSSTAQPSVATSGDTSSVNLGVEFTPSANGWITGIRFYKGSGNTGTHIGALWTTGGTPARSGDLHQRVRIGLAGGGLLVPDRGDGRHHLRRVLLRAKRRLLRTTRRTSPAMASRTAR